MMHYNDACGYFLSLIKIIESHTERNGGDVEQTQEIAAISNE